MKINKIILISLILIVSLTFITSISAQDSDNLNLTSTDDDIIELDEDTDVISDDSDCCSDDDNGSKPLVVHPDPENPNQVQAPTVQPAIDKAQPGDTIILEGTFVHCHFMINKTLNIIAAPGTSVGVCPHHTHAMKYGAGPESHGVFYISPEANGTVISGFSFTNDFYTIATETYNPFGVFVDADDVVLENLTFDWIGVKTSSYDPNDFLFNSVILNNTSNTTVRNIKLGKVNSFITSQNASDINTYNITCAEKRQAISDISASVLNIFVGDNGNLKVTLMDADKNPIANRNITVMVDGLSRTLSTDSKGIADLNVKYSAAGTYYAGTIFFGDDDYCQAVKNVKIVVSKKSTSLTAPKASLKVKKAKTFKITLKSGSNLISGKMITVKVNGKTFSAKTNSKGVASVKVKVAKKGTFTCTVKFAGDDTYKSSSQKGKIKVKK